MTPLIDHGVVAAIAAGALAVLRAYERYRQRRAERKQHALAEERRSEQQRLADHEAATRNEVLADLGRQAAVLADVAVELRSVVDEQRRLIAAQHEHIDRLEAAAAEARRGGSEG